MTRAPAAALLLILLAPLAVASGDAFHGEVRFPEGLRLSGEATLRGRGALDLGHAAPPGAFSLSWEEARGYVVSTNYTTLRGVPGAGGVQDPRVTREALQFGAGRVASLHCHAPCHAYLATLDADAEWSLVATLHPADVLLDRPVRTYAGSSRSSDASFAHEVPAGAWRVSRLVPGDAVTQAPTTWSLPPRVGLLLWNVTARIDAGDGGRDLDLRTRWEDASIGPLTAATERGSFAYLELRGPRLALADDAPFTLYLERPHADVHGALGPDRAIGYVEDATGRHALDGTRLRLEGDVRLAPLDDGPLGTGDAYALSGEGRVILGGATALPAAPRLAAAPLTLAALLGLLAVLVRLAVPLYSRIDRSRAVTHPNRRRILERLAQSPGSTVTDLCHATGLARGVMEHHLRILVLHGVVAVARRGRTRRYHRHDAPPKGLDADLALVHVTRKRIARAILDAPGMTQGEIASATRLSKRLVSYHLALLAETGLIESAGGLPRRYRATMDLRARLPDETPRA